MDDNKFMLVSKDVYCQHNHKMKLEGKERTNNYYPSVICDSCLKRDI